MPDEPKATLLGYLTNAREAMVFKLDGLSEYDVRRPLTASGTNLLGLVKHLANTELGYFGPTFDRPSGIAEPWNDEEDDDADMWVRPDESREEIIGLYRAAIEHADRTIAELPLDALGAVPWWPADDNEVTLHQVLVHMVAETCRHAGHADVLREGLDGAVGRFRGESANQHDRTAYVARVEQAAREAAP